MKCASVWERVFCLLTQSGGFHAGGSVDRVSEKAVTRHRKTHDPSYTWPYKNRQVSSLPPGRMFVTVYMALHWLTWVNPYSYPHGHVWHVPHPKGPYRAEDVQRHVGDFRGMLVAILLWQAWCYHVRVADGLHLDTVDTELKLNLGMKINGECNSCFHVPQHSLIKSETGECLQWWDVCPRTLYTSWLLSTASNREYRSLRRSTTSMGSLSEEMVVKPTMSLK